MIDAKIKHNLFREVIPLEILIHLLDTICMKCEEYYLIDNISFNKMVILNLPSSFLEQVKKYYHRSKYYFLDRPFSYNSFVAIIRHICNYHQLNFIRKIKYNHSEYHIQYFIIKSKTSSSNNI